MPPGDVPDSKPDGAPDAAAPERISGGDDSPASGREAASPGGALARKRRAVAWQWRVDRAWLTQQRRKLPDPMLHERWGQLAAGVMAKGQQLRQWSAEQQRRAAPFVLAQPSAHRLMQRLSLILFVLGLGLLVAAPAPGASTTLSVFADRVLRLLPIELRMPDSALDGPYRILGPLILAGALLCALGLLGFWLQRRPMLPELWLFLLVGGVAASAVLAQPLPSAAAMRVPVPADRLTGAELLYPGQVIEVMVAAPDSAGTTKMVAIAPLEVVDLHRGAANTLLLAVPTSSMPTVQAALADERARLVYHLLPGTVTPTTQAAPATPTPLPTATPVLVRLELRTSDIRPRAGELVAGPPALLIAVPPASAAAGASPVQACVKIEAFLDRRGARQSAYDDLTTMSVLIDVPRAMLPELVSRVSGAGSVWLVMDQTCAAEMP